MKDIRQPGPPQGLETILRERASSIPWEVEGLAWMYRAMLYTSAAISVGYILTYVAIALIRMQYPFELEWMEGGVVDHVRRILAGEKLYVSPSLDFVPFLYPPLYYYVSALVSKLMGVGFEPLRLVSFLSSLGAFLMVFLIVRRETGSKLPAVLGAGLFAATFEIGGAWFDIARVDSLFVFLLLAGIYLVRFGGSPGSYIPAGLLVALAFFTKQAAIFVMPPLLLYVAIFNWHRTMYLAGALAIAVVGGTLALNFVHEGWYQFYVFDLPRQHDIADSFILGFWTGDLLRPMPIALALAGFYLFSRLQAPNKSALAFYGMVAGGMVLDAWFSRLHVGGWHNVLIPAYAALSILFGLGVHQLRSAFERHSGETRLLAGALAGVLALVQLAMLYYNPADYLPDARERGAGDRLLAAISAFEGDVLMPDHGFLPVLAGKQPFAHTAAIHDLLRSKDQRVRELMGSEIRRAVQERRFSAVIVDSTYYTWGFFIGFWEFNHYLEQHYRPARSVFDAPGVFWPVTGWQTRPETVFVPK